MTDARALIFTNLLNGVPARAVAATYRTSEQDVLDTFAFVLRKVKSYVFERKWPPVIASTPDEARRYRLTCLAVLPKLNLDKDPRYGTIATELVTAENAIEAMRDLRG